MATKSWNSSVGLQISKVTTNGKMTFKSNFFGSFAAGLFIPPNTIDFDKVFANFSTLLAQSPHVLIVMCSLFVLYILLLIWARRKDIQDNEKWEYTHLIGNDRYDRGKYLLSVYTGVKSPVRTTAKLFVVLYGKDGQTQPKVLMDGRRENFTRGSVNNFVLTTPETIGKVTHLHIWHEETESSGDYFLEKVVVYDILRRERSHYHCNQWLSMSRGDCRTVRFMASADFEGMNDFNLLLTNNASKFLFDDHLWFSVAKRPTPSRLSRVQRLTICVVVLFLCMVSNAMWFTENEDTTTGINLGPIRITFRQIWVGLVSSVLVVPPTLITMAIFKRSKPRNSCSSFFPTERIDSQQEIPSLKGGNETFHLALGKLITREMQKGPKYRKKNEHFEMLIDLQFEMDNERRTWAKQAKKKGKPVRFPWWAVVFGYILAFLTVFASAFFTLSYSLDWGPEKSTDWLLSFVFALTQSIGLVEPLKVLLVAVLMSCLLKMPGDEEEEEDMVIAEYAPQIGAFFSAVDHPKPSFIPVADKVINLQNLRTKRRTIRKDLHLTGKLRNILLHIFYLCLLIVICFANRDTRFYQQNRNLQNSLQLTDEKFAKVQRIETIFSWLNDTIFPAVFPTEGYNGDPYTEADDLAFIRDMRGLRLGPLLLRQLRVKQSSCQTADFLNKYFSHCNVMLSQGGMDKGAYGPGWVTSTSSVPSRVNPAFVYSPPSGPNDLTVCGHLDHYGGGGYMVEINSAQDSVHTLTSLKDLNWIDRLSRAVIVELTVNNANVNVFSMVRIIVELPAMGGIFIKKELVSFRPYPYVEPFDFVLLIVQVIWALLVIVLLGTEVVKMVKLKKQYFRQSWHYIVLGDLCLSFTSMVCFVLRTVYTILAVEDVKNSGGHFVCFDRVAIWDNAYTVTIALDLFLATLQLFRPLTFNKHLAIVQSALTRAFIAVTIYMFTFGILLFSYAQALTLVFGPVIAAFRTLPYAMLNLFGVMLGVFKYHHVITAETAMARIFFTTFAMTMNLIILNMFISIINDGLTDVKGNEELQDYDEELAEHVWTKLDSLLRAIFRRKDKSALSDEVQASTKTPEATTGTSPSQAPHGANAALRRRSKRRQSKAQLVLVIEEGRHRQLKRAMVASSQNPNKSSSATAGSSSQSPSAAESRSATAGSSSQSASAAESSSATAGSSSQSASASESSSATAGSSHLPSFTESTTATAGSSSQSPSVTESSSATEGISSQSPSVTVSSSATAGSSSQSASAAESSSATAGSSSQSPSATESSSATAATAESSSQSPSATENVTATTVSTADSSSQSPSATQSATTTVSAIDSSSQSSSATESASVTTSATDGSTQSSTAAESTTATVSTTDSSSQSPTATETTTATAAATDSSSQSPTVAETTTATAAAPDSSSQSPTAAETTTATAAAPDSSSQSPTAAETTTATAAAPDSSSQPPTSAISSTISPSATSSQTTSATTETPSLTSTTTATLASTAETSSVTETSSSSSVAVSSSVTNGATDCTNDAGCRNRGRCVSGRCNCSSGASWAFTGANCQKVVRGNRMYPYGSSHGDSFLTGDDRVTSFQIPIYVIMGTSKKSRIYVTTNGYVSLGQIYLSYRSAACSRLLNNVRTAIIAPYWMDLDGCTVYTGIYDYYSDYNNNIAGSYVLQRGREDVQNFASSDVFNATMATVVTWEGCRPFSSFGSNEEATFQAVILSDGVQSYVIFNYKDNGISIAATTIEKKAALTVTDGNNYCKTGIFSTQETMGSIDKLVGNSGEIGVWFYQLYTNPADIPNYDQKCRDWAAPHSLFQIAVFRAVAFPCPCSLFQAWRDFTFARTRRTGSEYSGVVCFTARWEVLVFGKLIGQECCYSRTNFALITEANSIATGSLQVNHERFLPTNYLAQDFNPKLDCCLRSDNCETYFTYRPNNDCRNYIPPRFTFFFGDPHFKTLDGLQYTFNGRGEYCLVDMANKTFLLQTRLEQAIPKGGGLANATIFSAFVAKDINSDKLQVQLTEDRQDMEIYVGTTLVSPTLLSSGSAEYNNLDLLYSAEQKTLTAIFASQVTLNITLGVNLLMFSVNVPESRASQLKCLMGNYDGNTEDDLTARNGTVLPSNSTDEQIYYNFGETWRLTEAESMFDYRPGYSAANYTDPSFLPVFTENLEATYGTEKYSSAVALCDNLKACVYDFLITGDGSLANETRDFDVNAEKIKLEIENRSPNITSNPRSPIRITVNVEENFELEFMDPDNDTITASLAYNRSYTEIKNVTANKLIFAVNATSVTVSGPVGVQLTDGRGGSTTWTPTVDLCSGCSGQGSCNFDQLRDGQNVDSSIRLVNCNCSVGYTGVDCESEIDGCADNPCPPTGNCTDLTPSEEETQGVSFRCLCPSGYFILGLKCIDIDECSNATLNTCNTSISTCVNIDGDYTCTCHSGFRNTDAKTCVDTDECTARIDGCQQICTNTIGNFTCSCQTGYTLDADGKNCTATDIAVCAGHPCVSPATCYNNNGSPGCFCPPGYDLLADSVTCNDIDECSGSNLCSANSTCQNTLGGYECACAVGFKRESDMRTCTGPKKERYMD
ncbi:uncharacterized protein LOC106153782 [Lingula anatina]|uniref:Uncharacterized protein LOC106153782 n=1 Tax=Lingula anatina TaxID=7574 RepID=A0A1S3HCT2_LINAN|nr:uncharacterized protein LOC106153782 [Lingula anatina]|eukprot:XP_013383336.2 uncharacterized protein LOC106153782 [Lingula anatina]